MQFIPTRIVFLLCSLLSLGCGVAVGQQAASPRRPKIGVALSGGGALGLAHIGVLKYFDEQRIPIDYIAGTSMGGLVAGFYATGRSGAELETIIRTMDWDDVLRLQPRYKDYPIREKQSQIEAPTSILLRFGDRFSLPSGINSAQSLGLMLSRYTAAYGESVDFDQLPVPFRCVSTDLQSGEAYVFRQGSMPLALRATMAIPGIFTPVAYDGKTLVDGGLVNNLPVDVVRAMGADIVIAIHLDSLPVSSSNLSSLTRIFRQSVAIAILQNEHKQLRNADIIVSPDTGMFTATDYEQGEALVETGYAAARNKTGLLSKLALSEEEWSEHRRGQLARRKAEPPEAEFVIARAQTEKLSNVLQSDLNARLGGQNEKTARKVEEAVRPLLASTYLAGARYAWTERHGKPGLLVDFEERRGRQAILRPALNFSVGVREPSRVSFIVDGRATSPKSYDSLLRSRLALGFEPELTAEYFKQVRKTPLFVAPRLSFQRTQRWLYVKDDYAATSRNVYGGGLDLGFGTGRFVQITTGAFAGYETMRSELGASNARLVRDGWFVTPRAEFTVNTLNSALLPSEGVLLNAAAEWTYRGDRFPTSPRLRGQWTGFARLNPVHTVFLGASGATTFGKASTSPETPHLGGLFNLSAYKYDQLEIESSGALQAGYFARPKWNILGASLRPALWYEYGRYRPFGGGPWDDAHSGSLGMLAETPLGVWTLAVSVGDSRRTNVAFSLGPVFGLSKSR